MGDKVFGNVRTQVHVKILQGLSLKTTFSADKRFRLLNLVSRKEFSVVTFGTMALVQKSFNMNDSSTTGFEDTFAVGALVGGHKHARFRTIFVDRYFVEGNLMWSSHVGASRIITLCKNFRSGADRWLGRHGFISVHFFDI